MAFFHSPRVVTDGLVMYLDAANPKSYPGSGTTLYDLSGNQIDAQHQGTNAAKLTFENRNGGALKFDASGDDGSYPDPSEAYMRTTQNIPSLTNATVYVVFENGTANDGFTNIPSNGDCVLRMQNSDIVVRPRGTVSIGTNYNDIDYTPSSAIQNDMALGKVEFIAATFDGYTTALYRNGEYVGEASEASQRITSAGLLHIGTRNDANYENWSGWLYKLLIYDTTHTSAEISQHYNAFKSRFGL